MESHYCSNCGKITGHKRALGVGTVFAAVLTGGFWLLALPFYPKRCIICGATWEENKNVRNVAYNSTPIFSYCPHCDAMIDETVASCQRCGSGLLTSHGMNSDTKEEPLSLTAEVYQQETPGEQWQEEERARLKAPEQSQDSINVPLRKIIMAVSAGIAFWIVGILLLSVGGGGLKVSKEQPSDKSTALVPLNAPPAISRITKEQPSDKSTTAVPLKKGQQYTVIIVSVKKANMHSGPGGKYSVVGREKRGVSFFVRERREDWYKVAYEGQDAWIHKSTVREEARTEEQCTIKDPLGQGSAGLLDIVPGVDEALGKAIDNNEPSRLIPYVECKLTDGDKVWVEVRLQAISTVKVLESRDCKPGTRGIVLTPTLSCESAKQEEALKDRPLSAPQETKVAEKKPPVVTHSAKAQSVEKMLKGTRGINSIKDEGLIIWVDVDLGALGSPREEKAEEVAAIVASAYAGSGRRPVCVHVTSNLLVKVLARTCRH